PPSNTSSSCPPSMFKYTTGSCPSRTRSRPALSRRARYPSEYGDPLTPARRCPPAALAARAGLGTHQPSRTSDATRVPVSPTAVLEVALLIEHGVVRQLLLAVVRERAAVAQEDRRVENAFGRIFRISDHHADAAGLRSHALECRSDLAAQTVVKQEILGRVAAQ